MSAVLREEFGNPSSVHHFGQRAKAALDEARSSMAALLGADPSEIVFTGSGTEGDNIAIRGVAEALEVSGRIRAKLHVSSDCPDTDFTVKLCDVYPHGKSMLVTDGIRRTSLRKSLEKREPMEPGKVYELEVDLWSTSLVFNKGHRIRVCVSSSNSPRFEPNPNTGEPHPAPRKTRVATNNLHVSNKYPSHILLPLYTGPDAGRGNLSEKPDRD